MFNRNKPFGYSPENIAKKNKEIQDKYKEQDKKKEIAKKMKSKSAHQSNDEYLEKLGFYNKDRFVKGKDGEWKANPNKK